MSLFSNTPVLVCGLGRSGLAAARLLRAEGYPVHALDQGPVPDPVRQELETLGCRVHADAGPTLPSDLPPCAYAVTSPGLPIDGPILTALRTRGIPVMSEIELGWRRHRGHTLAVTGSNGKSSVVKLLADALTTTGHRAVPCGNYGLPVCEAVMQTPPPDWLVIETSSFQLETCTAFRPDIAVLLNLLPNHLDRHGTMETYGRLKSRLFAAQTPTDTAIVPAADLPRIRAWSGDAPARWQTFGGPDAPASSYRWTPGTLHPPTSSSVPLTGYFDNPVLGPNAAAALAAAVAAGIPSAGAARALSSFEPLPHRSQCIADLGGIRWIDDSKATNLASLTASLEMQPPGRPIRLIAGGRPKETDFAPALDTLRRRATAIYLIGEAAPAMHTAWSSTVPCHLCHDLPTAVSSARRDASPGDTILLAPGCTSYDQFPSYTARGDAFRTLATAP